MTVDPPQHLHEPHLRLAVGCMREHERA
jgi:hypothetical protein